MKIEDKFIPKDLAILLKSYGISFDSTRIYKDGKLDSSLECTVLGGIKELGNINCSENPRIQEAPKVEEVIDWFEDKKVYIIAIPNQITDFWDGEQEIMWAWYILYKDENGIINDNYDLETEESEFKIESRREALIIGIREALENRYIRIICGIKK